MIGSRSRAPRRRGGAPAARAGAQRRGGGPSGGAAPREQPEGADRRRRGRGDEPGIADRPELGARFPHLDVSERRYEAPTTAAGAVLTLLAAGAAPKPHIALATPITVTPSRSTGCPKTAEAPTLDPIRLAR